MRARIAALALALACAAPSAAQIPVRYAEEKAGTIVAASELHRFLLLGAQVGDTLRITFYSRYTGGCCGYHVHRLDVWDGLTNLGSVDGVGALTVTLPSRSFFTIEVRARNNVDTGAYWFKINRLNDPVGADRIAFGWNMRGTIDTVAGFDVYTLRAAANSSAQLRIASEYTGGCCGYYKHYAEIVDAAGAQLARVDGNGASSPITFQAGAVYTLFVAARNYADTGWYAASLDCRSWPAVPCDCTVHSSNYGVGHPGTSGVPALTASAPARLGTTAVVDVGNSSGQQTNAFLLLGISADNAPTTYGGTILVAQPFVWPIVVPAAGLSLSFPIPNDQLLCGIGFALQTIQVDPGASAQLAFSRGLLLLPG